MNKTRQHQKIRTKTISLIYLCSFTVIIFLSIPSKANAFEELQNAWERIPTQLNGVEYSRIADFALEQNTIPWAIFSVNNRTIVCYWQNRTWNEIAWNFSTRIDSEELFVAPDGNLFLFQTGRERYTEPDPHLKYNSGALYLLKDGKATYITDYHYDELPNPVYPLYFDKQGRIWNWGKEFIAKFEHGRWERFDATIETSRDSEYPVVVEDVRGNVYFFVNGHTLHAYINGELKTDIPLPKSPVPAPGYPIGVWKGDDVLFIFPIEGKTEHTEMAIFNLATLNFAPNSLWTGENLDISDDEFFFDRERNLWIHAWNKKNFIKISAKDHSFTETKLHKAAVKWRGKFPVNMDMNNVLSDRNGTMYFSTFGDGIYMYSDQKVTHFGWEQGVTFHEADWITEDRDGRIWFVSHAETDIFVYNPEGKHVALESPFTNTWEHVELAAGSSIIKDYAGNIWGFLEETPKKISLWNGRQWRNFDMGPYPDKNEIFVDNLNRVYNFKNHCRLNSQGVLKCFKNIHQMLVDSVRTGTLTFRTSDPLNVHPPLVIDGKAIWYYDDSFDHYYDGSQWHKYEGRNHVRVVKLKDNSIMTYQQPYDISTGKFFRFDKGRFVESKEQITAERGLLLGEEGSLPFKRTIYEANQEQLYPVRGMYVFESIDDFEDFSTVVTPTGRELFVLDRGMHLEEIAGTTRLGPSQIWLTSDGFLAKTGFNRDGLWRYYQGLIFHINLRRTPINPLSELQQAYDDRNNNLWLRFGWDAFIIKRGHLDTEMSMPRKDVYTKTAKILFSSTLDGEKAENMQYSWRVDKGQWSKPSTALYGDITFEAPGPHTVEVVAIDRMGNIDTTPASLTINVLLRGYQMTRVLWWVFLLGVSILAIAAATINKGLAFYCAAAMILVGYIAKGLWTAIIFNTKFWPAPAISAVLVGIVSGIYFLHSIYAPKIAHAPLKIRAYWTGGRYIVIGIGIACFIAVWWLKGVQIQRYRAEHNFLQWAGFPPPSAVSHIQYKEYHGWVGKDMAMWIAFQCPDEQLIQRLVEQKGLQPTTGCTSGNPFSAPSWWERPESMGLAEAKSSIKAYADEQRSLCYDTQNHMSVTFFIFFLSLPSIRYIPTILGAGWSEYVSARGKA